MAHCEASSDAVPAAAFGARLLQDLRARWGSRIRVTTSHFDLVFSVPGQHPFWREQADQQVLVRLIAPEQVEMSLTRMAPRRGESRAAGPVTVTGDFTKPNNALPAVEALLMQLV